VVADSVPGAVHSWLAAEYGAVKEIDKVSLSKDGGSSVQNCAEGQEGWIDVMY
jgi:hypothetical protein